VIVPVAFEAHHVDHLRPVLDLIPHGPPGDVALVASYGALVKARRMKYRRFILAQHGAGQSYAGDPRGANHPGYPGGVDNHDVGLFLAPNEHAANRWRKAYPKAAVAMVGCPKLDTLPRRESGPGPVACVSFHWDQHKVPESMSALADFGKQLPALAERFTLIGHNHPKNRAAPALYRHHGIEWVPSFAEVCRRADVYVCDNSSTIFEFASTNRPVVVMNAARYRKNVDHGLRFWSAADVGIQAEPSDDLGDVVQRALDEDWAVRREAALNIVYGLRTNGAQAAATAITDWLGSLAAAA
jgi:hypothetical protein